MSKFFLHFKILNSLFDIRYFLRALCLLGRDESHPYGHGRRTQTRFFYAYLSSVQNTHANNFECYKKLQSIIILNPVPSL